MKDAVKELRKDFKESLSRIDFNEYDPYSKKFMTASFVGQMWFLVKSLMEDDDVEEEIDGARTYLEKYLETNDAQYRDMAKDELRHAGILIKKHSEWADDEKQKVLDKHEEERQELMKAIDRTIKE